MSVPMMSILAAVFLAAALPVTALAQADGVAAGRRLAVESCAECHVVTTEQRRAERPRAGQPDAPDLVARMQDPAMTGLALRSFLQTAHPTMPNVMLTPAQTDDIVAYLLSLKAR